MPELPEVEIIRRMIAGKVEKRTIRDIEILLPRLIKWPSASEFLAVIRGKTINSLERCGKYLLFFLSEQRVLVIHLRMTGRLYYVSETMRPDSYVRIVFHLDNGDRLFYSDTRTLGTLYLLPESELSRIAGIANMGPEPLTPEFNEAYLQDIFKTRTGKIKSILLDQKLIGGLGNIYADEALALAGIRPERKAESLSSREITALYLAINKVIEAGINDGGTSFRDYLDGEGRKGKHQEHLYVYGRKDEPCRNCGTPIVKINVGGRGTHFCPSCQK